MVGSSIKRLLEINGYKNLIYKNRKDLDLINQRDVIDFFKFSQPEYVFLCAAKVGGILANNSQRADFIFQNIQIQNNIIHNAYLSKVKKLIFLGSSCIYPKDSKLPIKEKELLRGILEKTNEPYAIAKIAGIKMCESYFYQYGANFFSLMPCNAYGKNDNYNLNSSHVLPALIRKFHEAKINNNNEVTIWGTGNPLREFIYVDDIAKASLHVMNLEFNKLYDSGLTHLNVGSGQEISISDLAYLIAECVGFSGKLNYDDSKPDGTFRKVMDSSCINQLGWKTQVSLKDGIKKAYRYFIEEVYE